MITENQLRALDFEYNEELERWGFKDIAVYFNESDSLDVFISLNGFQLYGINDHRDLSKFIKLVYGE
jgi:hypothetical protein